MTDELAWRKSSFSDNQGGACVEVAALPGMVLLRDSKVSAGPHLAVCPDAWRSLLSATTHALKA